MGDRCSIDPILSSFGITIYILLRETDVSLRYLAYHQQFLRNKVNPMFDNLDISYMRVRASLGTQMN